MVNQRRGQAKIEEWRQDYAGEGRRNASTAARELARDRR
jgi:malonyl-CoA decarboxylase